jgi:hypothetical protein
VGAHGGRFNTKTRRFLPARAVRAAKRFGPNPSQAPGRDVRFREFARDRGVVLLGKLLGPLDGRPHALSVDGASLHANMQRIEQNVADRRRFIEAFVAQNAADDPDLRGLPPMEAEPDCAIPDCELSPLSELDLDALNIQAGRGRWSRSDAPYCILIASQNELFCMNTKYKKGRLHDSTARGQSRRW